MIDKSINAGIPGISANTPLFGFFPTMEYDINNIVTYLNGPHETVTDIFFRFSILRNIINNTSSYYVYSIQDGDTPDLLSENVYNDRGAGWMILYANRIFDPQFDWPLDYDAFQKMIVGKYGSVEIAQETIHHSVMTITRTNQFFGTTSVTEFQVDTFRLSEQFANVSYPYYTPWTAVTYRTADSNVFTGDDSEPAYLSADITYDDKVQYAPPRSGSIPTITDYQEYEIDGKTVEVGVSGRNISMYDYELKLNDDKRLIKIIKSEYYLPIMNEFRKMTNQQPNYLRGFV